MEPETTHQESELSRFGGRLLLWVPLGLVFYVLSIGPAAAVFGDSPGPILDPLLPGILRANEMVGYLNPRGQAASTVDRNVGEAAKVIGT